MEEVYCETTTPAHRALATECEEATEEFEREYRAEAARRQDLTAEVAALRSCLDASEAARRAAAASGAEVAAGIANAATFSASLPGEASWSDDDDAPQSAAERWPAFLGAPNVLMAAPWTGG